MKTFPIILFALFLSASFASAQDTLYVYQGGAVLYKRVISAVDSVTFQKVYTTSLPVTDKDGNVYQTVTIGTQTWMASNLRVTHYRNGESITNLTVDADWAGATFGAWCDYSNLAANGTKYGHLYNWYAAIDSRNIAPVGWHVPTDAEWTTLVNYVSANLGTSGSVAKALAAATNWAASTGAGAIGNDLTKNNSSGFSALPGGYRYSDNGTFRYVGSNGNWWSATEGDTGNAWNRLMDYYYSLVYRYNYNKTNGFSVRCLRDN